MEALLIAPATIEAAERRIIEAAVMWIAVENQQCASALADLEDAVSDLWRLRRERRQSLREAA